MYCSTSVTAQVIRGVLAAAAIAGAILLSSFWPAMALLALAVYLMRGCPACWLAGLMAAIRNRDEHKQV
jgi:hypothetical protein